MDDDTRTPADATGSDDAATRRPRTAVVTGAGRGIGRGLALGLARHGYDVVLAGRTVAHLEAVAAEIAEQAPDAAGGTGTGGEDAGDAAPGSVGGRPWTLVVPVDLTDGPAVQDAARRIEEALAERGGLSLLVNNAGVIEHAEAPFAEDDVEDVWRVIEVNLRGPLLLTHALLPGMLRRGGGRVVNINSGSGHRPSRAYTGYGISKGALARLTTLLDAQYRDQGIVAVDLAPGVVVTDMTAGMPTHTGRTEWTPVEKSVELLLAVGDGRLDALAGRFLRAGDDTVAELQARAYDIVVHDARTLRLVRYGATDPLRT